MKKLVTMAIVGVALAAAATATATTAVRSRDEAAKLEAEARARVDERLHAILVDMNARRARGERIAIE